MPLRPFLPVTLEITEEDIADMNYFCNECPMAYPAAQNAITFALARLIDPELKSLVIKVDNGNAWVRIEDDAFWLSSSLGLWLNRAMRGFKVAPVRETIWLPKDILRERIRKIHSTEERAAA